MRYITLSRSRLAIGRVQRLTGGLVLAVLLAAPAVARAQTIIKQTTGTDLNAGASWVGGTAPGSSNVASWTTTSLGGALTIGSNVSWQGIDIQGATTAITTSGAGTLTLGSSGISLASGGVNLTLGNSRTFGTSSNVTVNAGRILTLSGGTTTFAAGTTTTLNGPGEVQFGGSNHTLTGSGALDLSSGILRNNIQSGSTSGFTGDITLRGAAAYYQNSTAAGLGTGTVTIGTGGAITGGGTGANGTRSIANNIVLNDTLTVQNEGASNSQTTLSGNISGSGGVVKNATGTGSLILSGTNTYTGATTVNAGTLSLTGTLSSSSTLVGGGGTFSHARAAAQTLNGLTVNTGASTVTNTNSGTTNILALGAITRSGGGGVVNFSTAAAANNVVTTTTANTNGILGPWATRGNDWAANDGSGKIVTYTAYTDVTRLSSGTKIVADNSASNIRIVEGTGTAADITLGSATTAINTLLQTATGGAGTVALSTNTLQTSGIWVVSGAGSLTLSAGTLTAATAGGELFVRNSSSNTLTIGSVIANNTSASSLTIVGNSAGNGIVTLSGANSFTGGTTLSGIGYLRIEDDNALGTGPLTFNNSAGEVFRIVTSANRTFSNNVTFANDGQVRIGVASTGTFNFSGPISLAGGARTFDMAVDATFSGNVSDGGATPGSITKTGASSLTLSGSSNTYSGGTTLNQGTLAIGNNSALGTGTISINGGSIGSNSSTARTVTNNFLLNGNALFGGTGLGTGALVLNGTFNLGGAVRTIESPLTGVVSGAGAGVIINGVVSNGGITKDGAGILTVLNNDNSLTGDTIINTGSLVINQRSIATSSSVTLNNSGILVLTENGAGTHDINNLSGASGTSINTAFNIVGTATARSLNVNQTIDGTFAGFFTQGSGARIISLVKSGAAALTLTNSTNAYTGSTTVNDGTLRIGGAGRLNSGNYAGGIALASGGTLSFETTADQTLSGAISGQGSLRKSSTGTLTLSTASTLAGTIDISGGRMILTANHEFSSPITIDSGGTLQVGNNTTAGTIGNAATVVNNGAIEWNRSNETNVSTAISGTGTLTTLGAGILSLNGENALSGTTTISAGTLRLGGGGTAGSLGGGSVVNNATFAFNRSNALTVANAISGTGAVIQQGAGTTTLTSTNTYSGVTTVSAGTLLVNGSLAADSAVTVQAAGTLGGTGTVGGATTIFGTHSPGASPGVQTFGSNLSYDNATVIWELTGNTVTQTAPAVFDQVLVGGNLDFTSPTSLSLVFDQGSTVDWTDVFWDIDREWLLYDVTGTTANFSNLTISTQSWLDGSGNVFSTARPQASFSLRQAEIGGDVFLTYVAVPEPGTLVLAGCGLVLAAWRLARRRIG